MFDIVGGKIVLSADTLAIPPFKKYYENSKNKDKTRQELEYVVWKYKWNTPYLAYSPEVRDEMICNDMFGTKTYQESPELKEVIRRYDEFQYTPLTRMYKTYEEGLEYLMTRIHSAREEGMDPKIMSALLKDTEPISRSLENAKARAISEQQNTGRVRGGGTVGHYEMPRKQ